MVRRIEIFDCRHSTETDQTRRQTRHGDRKHTLPPHLLSSEKTSFPRCILPLVCNREEEISWVSGVINRPWSTPVNASISCSMGDNAVEPTCLSGCCGGGVELPPHRTHESQCNGGSSCSRICERVHLADALDVDVDVDVDVNVDVDVDVDVDIGHESCTQRQWDMQHPGSRNEMRNCRIAGSSNQSHPVPSVLATIDESCQREHDTRHW